MAHTPVTMPPIGKMMMFNPGTTNAMFGSVTTRVWIGATTWDLVGTTWVAKTPLTKVASEDESVVLTVWPVAFTAVKVTVGTRTFWRSILRSSLVRYKTTDYTKYLRSHVRCNQVRINLSRKCVGLR